MKEMVFSAPPSPRKGKTASSSNDSEKAQLMLLKFGKSIHISAEL